MRTNLIRAKINDQVQNWQRGQAYHSTKRANYAHTDDQKKACTLKIEQLERQIVLGLAATSALEELEVACHGDLLGE